MALQLVLAEGRPPSLQLPLGRAGTLGWGSDVAVCRRGGSAIKGPWSDASQMRTWRSPPLAPKQASTVPARVWSLHGHTAPCKRETTCTRAWLCQLQPFPVPRLTSSPGVQSQPCLPRWWQQLPGAVCRIRNPTGSRHCVWITMCMGSTGVLRPWHAGTGSAGRGGRDVPGTSGSHKPLDLPAGVELAAGS